MRPGARAVAVAFLASGTTHLVRPQVFEPLVPPVLPAPRAWVVGTGVAEIASAVGLLTGQPWGRPATVATLLAVWPGNWWHAVDTQRRADVPTALKIGLWLRLPMQLPMLRSAMDPYDDAGPRAGSVTTGG